MTNIDPEITEAVRAMNRRAQELYPSEARRISKQPPSIELSDITEIAGIHKAQNRIVVNPDFYAYMMEKPGGKDTLKAVLAHEVAHKYLPHVLTSESCFSKGQEIQADIIGGKLFGDLAKYKQSLAGFMEYAKEKAGISPHQDFLYHPSTNVRNEVMGIALGISYSYDELPALLTGEKCEKLDHSAVAEFKKNHHPRDR